MTQLKVGDWVRLADVHWRPRLLGVVVRLVSSTGYDGKTLFQVRWMRRPSGVAEHQVWYDSTLERVDDDQLAYLLLGDGD